MEIAKIHVGQNFAQDPGQSSAAIHHRETSALFAAQQEQAKEDTGNGASVVKKVQENSRAADTENSERQQQEVETAAREIEAFLQVQARNLSFSVDEKTQRSVVTVKDSESGDVIRQIPSEEVLRLAERIKELQDDVGSSVGVLLNNQV